MWNHVKVPTDHEKTIRNHAKITRNHVSFNKNNWLIINNPHASIIVFNKWIEIRRNSSKITLLCVKSKQI